jgi:H+-translocating NAD(P) transhydrogenase subunit alpha
VKEQVESLGAKFIDVPYETAEEKEAAEGVGGYAKPMPQSWLDRQKVEVAKRVAQADIVISTALIPGRAAPVLITEEMVKSMKPGSVIVDMARRPAATARSPRPARRWSSTASRSSARPTSRRWWRPTRPACTRATCSTS